MVSMFITGLFVGIIVAILLDNLLSAGGSNDINDTADDL